MFLISSDGNSDDIEQSEPSGMAHGHAPAQARPAAQQRAPVPESNILDYFHVLAYKVEEDKSTRKTIAMWESLQSE